MTPTEQPAETPETKAGQPSKGRMWLGAGVLVMLLIAAGSALSGGGMDADAKRDFAKDVCRDAVRQQLNAPSTARFHDERVTGSGPWSVTGVVEAENMLGGRVSRHYSCTSREVGDSQRATATLG